MQILWVFWRLVTETFDFSPHYQAWKMAIFHYSTSRRVKLRENSAFILIQSSKFQCQALDMYCKPTFIRERENLAEFARTSSSQIFLAKNQMLYGSPLLMKKPRSWKSLASNQIIKEESRNKVDANKCLFTVSEPSGGWQCDIIQYDTAIVLLWHACWTPNVERF
jgi:hypothetical protein